MCRLIVTFSNEWKIPQVDCKQQTINRSSIRLYKTIDWLDREFYAVSAIFQPNKTKNIRMRIAHMLGFHIHWLYQLSANLLIQLTPVIYFISEFHVHVLHSLFLSRWLHATFINIRVMPCSNTFTEYCKDYALFDSYFVHTGRFLYKLSRYA